LTHDGKFTTFVRSDHGRDAANSLWVFDVAANVERKIVDPRTLLASDTEDLPDAERARRERMRETTAGVTSYSSDDSGYHIAFALSGQLFVTDLSAPLAPTKHLEVTGPIIAPQISPDGSHVAWSTGMNLHVCAIDGSDERVLTTNNDEHVSWGLADFIGSEELGRMTGFWWAPNSGSLIVQRVDESQVNSWWISDPATPEKAPREQRYPAAGTTNATLELHRISLNGETTQLVWDNEAYEYLVSLRWQADRPALITVASRDQKDFVTYSVVEDQLSPVHKMHNDEFLEVIPGQPRWIGESLLTVEDNFDTDTRQVFIDGQLVSPAGMQVMGIIGASDTTISAVTTSNALDRQITDFSLDGELSHITSDGVASATTSVTTDSGELRVVIQSKLSDHSRTFALMRDGSVIHQFDSHAEIPRITIRVNNIQTGEHNVNTAVIFPTDHVMGSKKLPVMMRPYGGPHGAQVLNSALIYAEDQWFADQGYVVVIADNRGTPGRGPKWDHAIFHDFVHPVLDDQVAALQAVAKHYPNDVDASRVAITGWSFGGYLAALAVMERPDVFHVGVAGAPVTEWKWYDTAYTERYLGHRETNADVYQACSLLPRASELKRPLMLVHGLADDNVVSAHSLGLSGELLAHRKPHTVLPLSGVSHMTPQEVVAENLMLLTLDFFDQYLAN
jgi:dipeptidyl-peptidase-4